ncbi:MAG TPA: hypothetical protein GX391_03830 [Firmicutes bacterium]|jgi:hypothetical protein|nr:hypothetical protein [Bacillota bacterium]HOQ23339.1 hypothetical protein [Bacillota bacterium]HPT66759.1 hypothetical protein [Bacillota bacterium]
MKNEQGYILILVIAIVCIISFAIILVMGSTVNPSYLAARRVDTVRAFPLAESAAMEGYWQLTQDPTFRGTRERYWSDGWYRYTIVDTTPGTNDLTLEVIGDGFAGNQQKRVRLTLRRANLNETFTITGWNEEN